MTNPAEHEAAQDLRAPILVRYETTLQARHFRDEMQRLGGEIEQLEVGDRRPVFTLIRWLASTWIGLHGPSHRTLITELAPSASHMRAAVYSDPPLSDPDFWTELVGGSPPDLFESCSPDRRAGGGVWFELASGEG